MHNVNTLILSTPRSASTWYQQQLADDNGLLNLAEAFNYSQIAGMKSLRREAYNKWLDPDTPCVLKVFPYHITAGHTLKNSRTIFPDVFEHTQRTVFLVREDFVQQVRSLVVAGALSASQSINFHAQWNEEVFIPDSEELRNLWKSTERFLYAQMWSLGMLWKTYSHPTHVPEIVYTSELPQQHKYKRPIRFEWEPEIVAPDWKKNVFDADGTSPAVDLLNLT